MKGESDGKEDEEGKESFISCLALAPFWKIIILFSRSATPDVFLP